MVQTQCLYWGLLLLILEGAGGMIGSAIIGGLILALIEGVSILMTRISAEAFNPFNQPSPDDPQQLGQQPPPPSPFGSPPQPM